MTPSTSITKDLTERMFKDLATLFCDYSYRDVNTNDSLRWIGGFNKFINNSVYKDYLYHMNPEVKKQKDKNENQREAFK